MVLKEVFFNHRNNSDDIKITSAPSLFGIFSEVSSVTMPASLPPRLVKSARKEPPLRPRNFKERALKIIVGLIMLTACAAGCGKSDNTPGDTHTQLSILKEQGLDALRRNNNRQAYLIGDSMLRIMGTTRHDIPDLRIYALTIKSQGAILNGQTAVDALPLLDEAAELCRRTGNDFAQASVDNGLGLYYLKIKKNSNLGLKYFYRGLEAARRGGNTSLYGILLANIALTHIGNNSGTGLRYAFESYNYGKEHNDDRIICAGAIASADLYRQRGETELALRMIKEAENILVENHYDEACNLYRIYGEIMAQGKNYDEARKYMNMALKAAADDAEMFIKTSISYSGMMLSMGNKTKALEILKTAETKMNRRGDNFFRIPLLEALYQTYYALGLTREGDIYKKIHDEEYEHVTSLEDKEKIRDLQSHYDHEMAENAIVRNELRLLKERQLVTLLTIVITVILLACIPLIILYRHKTRLYDAIVKQTADTARNEKVLRETIHEMDERLKTVNSDSNGESQGTPTLSHEKYIDILGRLEALMLDPEVYTANDISKEKIAKMIGTNRTYLSKIINDYYGISFTQFITGLRIKEAMRRLSDPLDNTPIKKLSSDLGFNSLSTFYSRFMDETGITPANYRNSAMKLDSGNR